MLQQHLNNSPLNTTHGFRYNRSCHLPALQIFCRVLLVFLPSVQSVVTSDTFGYDRLGEEREICRERRNLKTPCVRACVRSVPEA
jgi:hypothetical protein